MADAPNSSALALITYADRLAADIDGVASLLAGPFAGACGGVHLLPFFVPIDGADAGFDPVDHTAVDPRVGSWDSVTAIASRFDLVYDFALPPLTIDALTTGDGVHFAAGSQCVPRTRSTCSTPTTASG